MWKLDEENVLRNKAFPHICPFMTRSTTGQENWSRDKWNFNFKINGSLIYIENSSCNPSRGPSLNKVFEAQSDSKVCLKDFEEDKAEQLWKKGVPNDEGYFTLENSKVPKVMTAISTHFSESSISIEMKGNITLKCIST